MKAGSWRLVIIGSADRLLLYSKYGLSVGMESCDGFRAYGPGGLTLYRPELRKAMHCEFEPLLKYVGGKVEKGGRDYGTSTRLFFSI